MRYTQLVRMNPISRQSIFCLMIWHFPFLRYHFKENHFSMILWFLEWRIWVENSIYLEIIRNVYIKMRCLRASLFAGGTTTNLEQNLHFTNARLNVGGNHLLPEYFPFSGWKIFNLFEIVVGFNWKQNKYFAIFSRQMEFHFVRGWWPKLNLMRTYAIFLKSIFFHWGSYFVRFDWSTQSLLNWLKKCSYTRSIQQNA